MAFPFVKRQERPCLDQTADLVMHVCTPPVGDGASPDLSSSQREYEMRESLKAGIQYEHRFVIPPTKTVPALYPEAEEFLVMPEVFATGFSSACSSGPASRP